MEQITEVDLLRKSLHLNFNLSGMLGSFSENDFEHLERLNFYVTNGSGPLYAMKYPKSKTEELLEEMKASF